jgi:hypothetical protein
VQVFGPPGLDAVRARLAQETRERTLDAIVLPVSWYPESHVIDWQSAIWLGPAQRDEAAFRTVVDKMLEHGFSRVHRAIMGLLTPATLLNRAVALWRHDHTDGEIRIEDRCEKSTNAILADHPYADDPVASMAITEVFRHLFVMSRAKNVCAKNERATGRLRVTLTWE